MVIRSKFQNHESKKLVNLFHLNQTPVIVILAICLLAWKQTSCITYLWSFCEELRTFQSLHVQRARLVLWHISHFYLTLPLSTPHPQHPRFSLHHRVRPQLYSGACHHVRWRPAIVRVRSASQANVSGAWHLLCQHHPGGLQERGPDQHYCHHQQVPGYTWSVTQRHSRLPCVFTRHSFDFLKYVLIINPFCLTSGFVERWQIGCFLPLCLCLSPLTVVSCPLQCPSRLALQRWCSPPPLCWWLSSHSLPIWSASE